MQHTVDLYCFYDDVEDQKNISEVSRYCNDFHVERIQWLGSRFRSLAAMVRGEAFSTSFFYSNSMANAIDDALRSRTYDLIWVFSSSMADYVRGRQGIPKVLDMVDIDSEKWDQYAQRVSPAVGWLWKYESRSLGRYEAVLVSQFDMTLLCTATERDSLRRKILSGGVEVLGNALDTTYFSREGVTVPDDIKRWQPYVIFSGAMDYVPNIDAAEYFCREILPLVRRKIPKMRFVIAGMNPSRAVRRLAKDNEILVTGPVADMRPYLCGAAVAVAPMRLSQGIQNKVLESLAMGLPVVTTGRIAATLPRDVASLLLVADEPQSFADHVWGAIKGNKGVARESVRRVLQQEYGSSRVAECLHRIVTTVTEGTKTELSSVSGGL